MWMALFYPRPEGDGDLLVALRLLFGSVMAGSIVLAFAAIRQRDVARHRAWMMRGYAVAQGAGTQALLFGLWALVFAAPLGQPGELTRALIHGVAWALNLAIAEWLIRRRRTGLRRLPRAAEEELAVQVP